MNENCIDINVSKVLPPTLIVRTAGTHLYSIGLSLYPTSQIIGRKLLYNPIVIFIINLQFLIRFIVFSLLPEQSRNINLYLGNVAYFIGNSRMINISGINCFIFVLLSQFVNYYNYR